MRNLMLLLVCQTVTTLGLMVFVPIMPLYIAMLTQVDAANVAHWSSLALAAPALGTLCFASYVGKWCDRFGYRRLLLISLIVFVASMLLMAVSSSIYSFILGRLLQGISSIGVVLTAFIGYISEDTTRGHSLGLQESAIACGSLAGPVLGGVMLDYWSLKPLLISSAVLTGFAGYFLWSRLDEPKKMIPVSGALFSGLHTVLAHNTLRNWMLAACLVQAAAFAFIAAFPFYIATSLPATDALASKIGLLHALGWFAAMIASPLWGRLNDNGEPRYCFALAALGCTLSIGLLTVVDQTWIIALLRIVQGACYAALVQSVLLTCSRQLPIAVYGHVTGLSRSFMVIGQLLGPLIIILLLPLLSPVNLLLPVAVLFLAASLIVYGGGQSMPVSRLQN